VTQLPRDPHKCYTRLQPPLAIKLETEPTGSDPHAAPILNPHDKRWTVTPTPLAEIPDPMAYPH